MPMYWKLNNLLLEGTKTNKITLSLSFGRKWHSVFSSSDNVVCWSRLGRQQE
jgi:hypothetical protein